MSSTLLSAEPLPFDAFDAPPEEIARRFRQALELGRPRWLWPDLAVADWRESLRAIEATLRALLTGRPVARLEAPAGARALGVAAFTSGTGALLGHWIERGQVEADADCEALLRLHLAHGRARWPLLEQALRQGAAALHAHGIPSVLVKGMHTARVLFPEPGTRPMSDVDLVVGPQDFAAAEAALRAVGFTPVAATRESVPPHADWIPPGAPRSLPSLELGHAHAPLALNLRGGFAYPVFGSLRVDLGTPAPRDLRDWSEPGVQVLDGAWELAYLAVHASHHRTNLTLVRMLELVLAARATTDWHRFAALLRDHRAEPFVYPAVALAESLAPGTFPAAQLGALERRALARHRRIFATARPADVQPPGESTLADYVFWADGPAQWLRAVLAVAVPRAPLRLWPWLWQRRARLAWARMSRLRPRAGEG